MAPAIRNTVYLLLAIAVVIVFVLQLCLGSVSIPVHEVVAALTGGGTNPTWNNIIIESRLPGAIGALVAGAALSVSGLMMQTMFRNPVAGPFVLGISAGANLGVALLLMAASAFGFSFLQSENFMSAWGIILAAGIGSIGILMLNFFISLRINDVVAILIIGLMLGGGISAFIDILQAFSNKDALRSYVFWTFGSFRNISLYQSKFLVIISALGLLGSTLLSRQMDLLLLGDTYAVSSGLNVKRAKALIIIFTGALAGVVTAFCGPIGFVGLAVPHMARGLFRTSNHLVLIPACILLGAVVCSACNLIAAMPGTDMALPVNSVTSILGAPFVIWIIVKQKRRA